MLQPVQLNWLHNFSNEHTPHREHLPQASFLNLLDQHHAYVAFPGSRAADRNHKASCHFGDGMGDACKCDAQEQVT